LDRPDARSSGHVITTTIFDAEKMPTERDSRPLLGVLISGRGSNLQAIVDAVAARQLDAEISIVISSRPDALGLARASDSGIDTLCLKPRDYPNRDAYDQAIANVL